MNGMLLSLNTWKQRHTGTCTLYYCNKCTVVSSLFLGIFMDFIKPTVSKVYTHFQTKALSIQIVVMNFILLK